MTDRERDGDPARPSVLLDPPPETSDSESEPERAEPSEAAPDEDAGSAETAEPEERGTAGARATSERLEGAATGGDTPADGEPDGDAPGDGEPDGDTPGDGEPDGDTPADGEPDGDTPGDGDGLAPVSKRNRTDVDDSVFTIESNAPAEASDEAGESEARSPAEPAPAEPATTDDDEPAKKSDGEPDSAAETRGAPAPANPEVAPAAQSRQPRAARSGTPTFYVAGFWRRLLAACIDSAIILPVSLLMCWLAGALTSIHLPAARHRGFDFWLDLLLSTDPAFVGGIGLILAIAAVYLLVFQITQGRTLGMKVLKIRIIDVYGDSPSTLHSALRTAGYLAGLGTLGLGFLWVGFDSEKRGLHDWISSTYVVKA